MINTFTSNFLIVIALFPLFCISTCPNHALLGCVLRLKAQRVPFEKNMMNVVFNIATEAKLLRTCRVYSNTMPCFREKIVDCGDDKQKRMLDEVGRMLMFICSPFSLQRQRNLIKHQRCISAVLNLPPTTDCAVENTVYSRDLIQCRKNCASQSSNFLCTMQNWMSEQNVCTMQSLEQKCGEEAAGLYEQMQVTVFEPHFPIICDRVGRPAIAATMKKMVTTTSKASTATASSSVPPSTFHTTTSTSKPSPPSYRASSPTSTVASNSVNEKIVDIVERRMTNNEIDMSPTANRTIADLWDVYTASNGKYQELSQLWRNKKLGLLIDSVSNGTLIHSSTINSTSTSTVIPPVSSTERQITTTTNDPPTSAVSPRTIKVINILRRLLPDYMPQLSSIFEHVRDGNDLLVFGATSPLPLTTTTYLAKKSSFKRPFTSFKATQTNTTPHNPTNALNHQRAVHRMAPRSEKRLPVTNEIATAIPSTHTTIVQSSSYSPQFPIASFDPNTSSRMLRLPEALFESGNIHKITTKRAPAVSSTSMIHSPLMAEDIKNYRISYLPTRGTSTTLPIKDNEQSNRSFPDLIKSLMRPIPATESTQKFFAYPPSNPKFYASSTQEKDSFDQPTLLSVQQLNSVHPPNNRSGERVVREVEKWKPWYLGGNRRI